jgi:site-specific recombinase XerC
VDNTSNILFKFKEHLKVLNRSPATIKSYIYNLKHFLYSTQEPDMKKVTKSMIESYIAGLYDYRTIDGKPYKTSTLCIKIRSVKRFFEYLEKANIIFIDPTETIKEPKKEMGLIKDVLTPKEANKILDQPNLGTLLGIRHFWVSVTVRFWNCFILPVSGIKSCVCLLFMMRIYKQGCSELKEKGKKTGSCPWAGMQSDLLENT